jgi:hypothetical protein
MDRNKTTGLALLLAVLLFLSLALSGCAGKDSGDAADTTGKTEESGKPETETRIAPHNSAA